MASKKKSSWPWNTDAHPMKHSRNGTYSHTRVHLIKSVFDHFFDHLYNNIYIGGQKPISAAKAAGLGKSDKSVDGICQIFCGGRCRPLSSFINSPFTTGTFQEKVPPLSLSALAVRPSRFFRQILSLYSSGYQPMSLSLLRTLTS